MNRTLTASLLLVLGLSSLAPLSERFCPTARAHSAGSDRASQEEGRSPADPTDPVEASRSIGYDAATGEVLYDAEASAELPPIEAGQERRVPALPHPGTEPWWPGKDEGKGPGETPGGGETERVFGRDTRYPVTDTRAYPCSTQCKLYISFPLGASEGSGTLVGSKYVLTAGHNLYDKRFGGWADKVVVYAALNGTESPFPEAESTAFRVFNGWYYNSNSDYDMGLMMLNKEIGSQAGWLGMNPFSAYPSLNGYTATLVGYPMDKNQGYWQYITSGRIKASTTERVYYELDTGPGMSGSGLYFNMGWAVVFGVHTDSGVVLNGRQYNAGARLTDAKLRTLTELMARGF